MKINKKLVATFLFVLFLVLNFSLSASAIVTNDPVFPYYSKGPHVDVIHIKYLAESEQIPALRTGKINVSAWNIPSDAVQPIILDSNTTVETNASLDLYYLVFNLKKLPFNNSTYNGKDIGRILRQAIAHAIDKEELVDSALYGWGTPIDSMLHVGYGIWHNPNIPTYEFNLTLAAEMLDDAGIVDTDDDGIRNDPRTGFNIMFVFEYPSQEEDPVRYTAGHMIAEWLQQIGLGVQEKPTSILHMIYDTYIYENFTVSFIKWISYDDVLNTFYWLFNFYPPGVNIMGPLVGYQNDTFVELTKSIQSELNQQKLVQDVYKLQELLAEELPCLPLFTKDRVYAHRTDTVGFVNMPNGIMGRTGAKLSMLNVHSEKSLFGGALYWGMLEYPVTINPLASSSNIWSFYIQDALWDNLIQLDAALGVEPGLAENWTVEPETIPAGTEHVALENIFKTNTGNTNPIYVTEGGWSWSAPTEDINGTVITWYLRDGIKWSDGTPLTADDVNFTYYLKLNYDNSSWSTNATGGFGAIWKIEVLNDTTVRIHIAIRDPFVAVRYAIAPLPRHVWKSHWNDADTWTLGFDTTNDTLIIESTVGSGPFVWKQHTKNEEIILTRNPYYWNQIDEWNNHDHNSPPPPDYTYAIIISVVAVAFVVVFIAYVYLRKKKT